MKTFHLLPAVCLLSALCLAHPVHAGTNAFLVPTHRGEVQSTHGYWERFTVASGAPGNLADQAGSSSTARLTQTGSTQSFITGTGNIYDSSDSIQRFEIADPSPFILGSVILQTRSLGSELDYSSVILTAAGADGSVSLQPLFRLELDRGVVLGASVSSLFQWDLRDLGVQSYTISFSGAESSVSFDAMTLDTWTGFTAVPEPSSWMLALTFAAALLAIRRLRTDPAPGR